MPERSNGWCARTFAPRASRTQAGARQTLAANPLPPALDEIQAEMHAYQAERRAAGRSRDGWCWMSIRPGCYGTARRHN